MEGTKVRLGNAAFCRRMAGKWAILRAISHHLWVRRAPPTIATACTSSARAIISAARLLEAGLADAAVIAGGADTFADMPLNGFHALGVLAGERTRPLTDHRPGITIGEGAGLMLLTRRPSAVKLSGWGESSDSHHMSSPEPGAGAPRRTVRGALSRAGPHARRHRLRESSRHWHGAERRLRACRHEPRLRRAHRHVVHQDLYGPYARRRRRHRRGLLVLGLMHGGLKPPPSSPKARRPTRRFRSRACCANPRSLRPAPS